MDEIKIYDITKNKEIKQILRKYEGQFIIKNIHVLGISFENKFIIAEFYGEVINFIETIIIRFLIFMPLNGCRINVNNFGDNIYYDFENKMFRISKDMLEKYKIDNSFSYIINFSNFDIETVYKFFMSLVNNNKFDKNLLFDEYIKFIKNSKYGRNK